MRHLVAFAFAIVLAATPPVMARELHRFPFNVPPNSGGSAYGPLGGATPGLSGFDIRFTNGDHRVALIGALPGWVGPADSFAVRLQDSSGSGDDPIAGSVAWYDLREYGDFEESGDRCLRTCRLRISPLQQDEVFVLLGFYFLFESASDQHLREIAVQPQPYNGYIDVTFSEDSRTIPFFVVVKYAVVSSDVIVGGGRLASTTSARGLAQVTRQPGAAVIEGFRLAFTESDHHLERLTVDLSRADAAVFRLRDGDGDDPFRWAVSYWILAP